MENKALLKKWLIGGLITALIIVLIIWYRNYKKAQEAAAAEAALKGNSNNYKNTNTSVVTNDTGKLAYLLSPTSSYTTDGKFTLQVALNNVGGLLGTIIADKTDSGSYSWYKIRNQVGSEFYVAKFAVRVQ